MKQFEHRADKERKFRTGLTDDVEDRTRDIADLTEGEGGIERAQDVCCDEEEDCPPAASEGSKEGEERM